MILQSIHCDDPTLDAVVQAMEHPSGWHRIAPGETVLIDDRPFLDELQELALERRIGDDEPLSVDGTRSVEEVTNAVYERALVSDWEAVIATATSARSASGYLRLMLGDARWSLHEIRGALAEWREARRLGVDASMEAALTSRLADGEQAVRELDRATTAMTRNQGVAIAAIVPLGLLAWWLRRRLST
jgi:hypothetical protein